MTAGDHIHEHPSAGSALKSPTGRLLLGLLVTLVAVAVFSAFSLHQIQRLRDLQTHTVDRNRRDSLQLLRIQNNLQILGLAMRDMLVDDEPYGLGAWKAQVERVRADLDDALRIESELAPSIRNPERQQYLANSLNQFWLSTNQMFAMAGAGQTDAARALIRSSLQPQQAAVTSTVARLLVQNNESEELAMSRIQGIYDQAEKNVYSFLVAMLVAISLTSLYLIQFNRRMFARLARLSEQRSDLARKLITVQEELLRSISRELHDEFGQILTAMGALMARVQRQAASETVRQDLLEVRDIAQDALEKVRSLSQVLHPSVLDDSGLENAIDWYLPVFEKQTGIVVRYEKRGGGIVVSDTVAIHVYRILQEALNNVARHSKAQAAQVSVDFQPAGLRLEVRDRGIGLPPEKLASGKSGIGIVAMRERAELMNARLEFLSPVEGGTVVRLEVPLPEGVAYEKPDYSAARG